MKSKKFIFIICLTVFCLNGLSAQTNPIESEVIDQTISGIESIARAVISAAFTPLTDYDKGDLLFIGSPGFIKIRDVYQSPSIKGDPLYGGTLGVGAGYALGDRLMVYSIFTGLYAGGVLTGSYGGSGEQEAAAGMGFYSLFSGFGYEVIESEYFSLPVYIGLNTGIITLNLDYPEMDEGIYSFKGSTKGSDFLAGVSGGVAAKFKYRQFSLSPYFLYMVNFNGAEFTTDYRWTAGFTSGEGQLTHSIDPYRGAYFGLSAGISSKSGWFYNLSLKNLFPNFFKDNSSDAIDFTAVILTIGFRS